MTNKWSNDDYGNTVYKTAVFKDKDGTITGIPNSFIVNVTGIDADKNCVAKPTWNAVVCKGDVGRMNVGGGGGAVGFGGFGGGGGPPGPGGPGAGPARAAAPGPGATVRCGAPDLLLNLLSIKLPQVVVESEVPVHLQGRRSFSAAMARSSPPTGKPTYWRVASTR